MVEADLLLDPEIRLWVVVPIVIITFCVGLGRHFVSLLLTTEKKRELVEIMEGQAIRRSRLLRMTNRFIPRKAFNRRKHFFNDEATGLFKTKKRDVAPPNPMSDPTMMTNMMKGSVVNMIPMVLIGGAINWAFSGFITIKVPFPLTLRFRPMLQRDIELTSLGSSWVSSASFYLICVFGLRSIFTLILGENSAADEAYVMQQQMTGGGMGAPQDPGKAFQAEWEALEVTQHEFALADAERRLLNEASMKSLE
eukprot:m.110536 g.110536  ORF g.110536 m.110536 type:complete len:252 (+) comp22726_c0_seq2:40-795(+)